MSKYGNPSISLLFEIIPSYITVQKFQVAKIFVIWVSYAHQGCIYLIKYRNIVKYFSILIYFKIKLLFVMTKLNPQCHMIIQNSYLFADLVLKNYLLFLTMFEAVVHNILVKGFFE